MFATGPLETSSADWNARRRHLGPYIIPLLLRKIPTIFVVAMDFSRTLQGDTNQLQEA
jgi:hypothetical protein